MTLKTTESPFDYCRQVASHYENFPVGWFVPRRLSRYLYALYAFARTADDFADEAFSTVLGKDQGDNQPRRGVEGEARSGFAGRGGDASPYINERLKRLDEWGCHLDEAAAGKAEHPIFRALAITFRETALPPDLLHHLLQAFRWDIEKSRYKNFEELQEYCRFSANPVGRAVLLLSGYRDPQLLAWSDKICTGIQLVNHWQDIGVDLEKDRIYLPEEDLKRFGTSYEELFKRKVTDPFRSLMRFQLARTRALFYEGEALLKLLNRRLRWQVELMWSGPLKILEKIEAADFDIFEKRPTLSRWDLVRLFLKRRGQR